MELGKRLRQARLDAGLSQRQLCGSEITRNMLSQIENGTARPSMDTLRYLATRLEKPVSYFLDDDALSSPNAAVMEQARTAWDRKDSAGVLDALAGYKTPDPVYDRECALLTCLAAMAQAEEAIAQNRLPYAGELLRKAQQAGERSGYFTPELSRRQLLLSIQADPGQTIPLCDRLPSLDSELLLRAEAALARQDCSRAAALLDAAEDTASPRWNLLRGRVYLAQKDWVQAAACLHRAEDTFPETYALLEQCYRELGDYRQAYEYACRQKK